MPARDQGAKAGQKLDQTLNQSYQEYGYKIGDKIDQVRTNVNEKFVDNQGKTPEDHFRELYGASANLAGNTYNYAWSWVPFTKKKVANAKDSAHNAKEYAKHTSAADMTEDAKSKGGEYKEKAKNTELPGDTTQTLGGLINEARGLAGQVLDTAVYYVKVAEKTADDATSDAQATAKDAANDPKGTAKDAKNKTKAKGNSYIDQARNLTAYFMERTSDIVTYGQQKAGEAKDTAEGKASDAKSYADQVKQNGKEMKDNAGVDAKANTNGDRPHFAVSVAL